MLDVAVLASRCDPAELRALAVDWRIERLWASTERAVGAVLAGTPLAGSLALWTRNVTLGRERTVLENHLQRWLSGFAALPPRAALRGLGEALRLELAADEEPWRVKLRRTGRALRNASSPRSAHEDAAGVGRPSR